MTPDGQGTPWELTSEDDAVMVAFLESGASAVQPAGPLDFLAAAVTTSEAVVAATMTEVSTGVTALHLRHFTRSVGMWVVAGGFASPCPSDLESFYKTRHVDSPARTVDGFRYMASVEDDSGDVCLVTLAQTRQLAGVTAVVRYDEREQPVTVGINGLIPVLVRLRRGVFTDVDVLVRDSAGRVLSTTTL